MIHIETSSTYREEKEYIFSVIFKEFLGLTYISSFTGEPGELTITLPNNQKITFPEELFSTDTTAWLTKKSYPKLPLRYRSLQDIPDCRLAHASVPVLYGGGGTSEFVGTDKKSKIDIDIFGSVFFLLTLFEEFNRTERDEFGRFLYTESILYKESLLQRPIVNEYIEILWLCLKSKCQTLERKERHYEVKLSHDVDVPLVHTQSTYQFIRSALADMLVRKSFSTFVKRVTSRFSKKVRFTHDPNNNFTYLLEFSSRLGIVSEFNFIVNEGKGTIDERYEIDTPFFKELLSTIHKCGHVIGLHPSYFTFDQPKQLNFEFSKLKRICAEQGIHQDTWGGRQHYLRWENPITWRIWSHSGLHYDSSIGSEYFMGFRSGTCYPYSVFDLENRQHLSLVEYPLIVMDIAAFKLGDFTKYCKPIVDLSKVCKTFNGTFTLLVHNNYMISEKQKVEYESLLNQIV